MALQISRDNIVVPQRVDTAGDEGPTRSQSRGNRWRRTSPGLFVPAAVSPDNTLQRIVEAAAGAPVGAAVTGWAALHWQGAHWFDGRDSAGRPLPVPLASGDRRAVWRRDGVRVHYDWLFAGDVGNVDGLPLTRPERSTFIAATHAPTFEGAVQVIDMALASDLVSLEELIPYAELIRGRPGTKRLRSALAIADENVWSPMEVTMRLRWIARRSSTLLCNAPLFSPTGEHLLTPDLFDPEYGVAGEYDGVVHDEAKVRRRDLQREERARDSGIEVVSMVSTDLSDLVSFEQRLDAAYRRQSCRRPEPRWTVTPPPSWTDTSTVHKRRSLGLRPELRRFSPAS